MKVLLFDVKKGMVDAWGKEFAPYINTGLHPVEVCEAPIDYILKKRLINCLVSPANSFGFMDGGIDGVYSQLIPGIQGIVQRAISKVYQGELPVGLAHLVDTDQVNPIELAIAPTMRTPSDLRNELAINCYLAARAVFVETSFYDDEETVAFPGMGTGVGALPFDFVAKSMRLAYEDILLEKCVFPKTLWEASEKQQTIMSWLN